MEIIYRYASSPMTVIMAVSAANTDIAISDGLKVAKQLDPEGERTIGVLTKIDIMDEGVDALDLIQGKYFPLKLGYVGVVCRSQKDIMSGKPIDLALKAEQHYFSSSPVYAPFAHRLGIKYLSTTLNTLIVRHIKQNLPKIRSKINAMLFEKEKEMRALNVVE